jgi:hypothetical protein
MVVAVLNRINEVGYRTQGTTNTVAAVLTSSIMGEYPSIWRQSPMPIRILTVEQVDSKYRQARKSVVTEMEEWLELKTKLSDGLKRQEAAVVELALDPKNKNLRGSFKRNVRKYLRKLKLPYSVRAMRSDGVDVVIVSNDEQPISMPARKVR